MSNGSSGIINMHGKEYRTVALRVNLFRELCPLTTGWGIHSELVHQDDIKVIVKAWVTDPEGRIIGTGYAEEVRNANKINKTSAMENCETSAIGRALAACGYAGEEYASANEVEGAIQAQEGMTQDALQKALDAIDKGDWLACCLMDRGDDPMWLEAWKKMGSKHRSAFKELQKIRDEYRNCLNDAADHDDEPGFSQLNNELNYEQARYLWRLLSPEAQTMMTNMRAEKEAA